MTTHQFKRKRAPNGVHILAQADVGPPVIVAICPDWRWARKVALGLAIVEGMQAERERKRAARLRKKKPHGIPGT